MANNKTFYKEGTYLGEVTDQAISKSSTGTFQFVLRFKVLAQKSEDGQFYDLDKQYERTMYRAITDKTVEYVVKEVQAMGYEGNGWAGLDPSTPGYHSFAGKEIEVVCKHDEYDNNISEKWEFPRGATSKALEVKHLDSSEKRQLDAMFGKALKGSAKPTPRPAPAQAAAVITDDDVPF